MNPESMQCVEYMGKSREKLLALEKEGKYVFHGSPHAIQTLEPRQAYGYDKDKEEDIKDGEPAIFATPFADVAIFRALINSHGVEGDSESGFGMQDTDVGEKPCFRSTKNLVEKAKEKIGKVYVLDKSTFTCFKGTECRTHSAIVPLEVIDVTADDLMRNIEIIE